MDAFMKLPFLTKFKPFGAGINILCSCSHSLMPGKMKLPVLGGTCPKPLVKLPEKKLLVRNKGLKGFWMSNGSYWKIFDELSAKK